MVGLSASWKVMGLVSGLALISSDWLIEMKSLPAFLVCSLMAICTCAARPPTMKSTPWPSMSSIVRWAPVAGLSSSSRNRTSTLRPITPPRALISSTASSAPRFWSAAMAPNGPVRGSGKPILSGPDPCALTRRRKCGPASTTPAATPLVVRKRRRVRLVIVEPSL